MFSRRRHLDRRRIYSRDFFESLVHKLQDANFNQILIVLPHNYESVDPKKSIVGINDFLRRDRNYAAIILIAKSIQKNETLKILFVNSSSKAIFADDTFPSAASEPPSIYFQSPDPARAYAIFEFFYEYLSQQSLARFIIFSITEIFSLLIVSIEIIILLTKHNFLIAYLYKIPIIFDILLVLISLIATYKFISQPSGLWIKQNRELKFLSLLKMAIRGELRDNPIVQLFVTIIGGLIVAIIAKIFKLF